MGPLEGDVNAIRMGMNVGVGVPLAMGIGGSRVQLVIRSSSGTCSGQTFSCLFLFLVFFFKPARGFLSRAEAVYG